MKFNNITKVVFLLFLLLNYLYSQNYFKNATWVFDGGGIYFILNETLHSYSPEKKYEKMFSTGDASVKIKVDSCGYYGYKKNLNHYTCHIYCNCGSGSKTCSDKVDVDTICDNNTNEGSCYSSYFVLDGGTCSCTCVPTGCNNCSTCCCGFIGSCSKCTGGSQISGNVEWNPVDTTQLDGECIQAELEKIRYYNATYGSLGIKWYREPDIHLIINDNCDDIESIENPDFSNYIDIPEFYINKVSKNSFKINIRATYDMFLEDYYDIYLPMKDNDLCLETTYGNLIFAIDHVGPRYFKVDLHPFKYVSGLGTAYDIRVFSLEPYLRRYFNVNLNEGIDIFVGIKGLSYCKFKNNPCFIFHLVDIGSTIKDVKVDDSVGLGMPSYSLEDSIINVNFFDEVIDFPSKKFTINYAENSKSFTLIGVDKLDNKNVKIFMIFPFDQPKSKCVVEKEVNGYTNFPFIRCEISSVNDKIKSGYLYFLLDKQKSISEVIIKFSNSLDLEKIIPSDFYKLSIENQNSYLINPRYTYPITLENVDIVYFAIDKFLNAENVVDFNFDSLEAKLKPNRLTVNLDLAPPKLNISSNDLMLSDGSIVNNRDVYELELERLEFLRIPATLKFNCQDPGSGSCIINITLSNGEFYQIRNNGEITINSYVSYIKINFYDELGNKANPVILNFKADLKLPEIKISFDKNPVSQGGIYYFVEDVLVFINSYIDGDSNKIKEICVNINSKNKQCFLGSSHQVKLKCELGSKCEYVLEIEAKSVLGIRSSKEIKIVVDKDPFEIMLNIINPNPIFQNNISYLNSKINVINMRCNLKNAFYKNGKVVLVKLKECDHSGNCNILYESNDFNNNIFLKVGKYNLKNKEGNLSLECVFDVGGVKVRKLETMSFYIDSGPPKIKTLLINNNEIKDFSEVIINNSYLNIFVQLEDEGVGIKQSRINFLNKEYVFRENLLINEIINVDGEYILKVESKDKFGRKLNKVYKIIIDNSPPSLNWQVIKKVGNVIKVKFSCLDYPVCYIRKVECNGDLLFNNKINTVELECSFSENKPITEWYIVLEDVKGKLHKKGPIRIEGILKKFDIEITPTFEKDFYCTFGSFIPILLKVYNYLSDEDILVNFEENPIFLLNPTKIYIKRGSHSNILIFVSCVAKQTVKFKFNITSSYGTDVLEKQIRLIPIFLN